MMKTGISLRPRASEGNNVEAGIFLEDREVGEIAYLLYPESAVVVNSLGLAGRRVDHLGSVISEVIGLLGPRTDPYSGHYIHHSIEDPLLLLAYKTSAIGPTAELTGLVGGRLVERVPLLQVPDREIRSPGVLSASLHYVQPGEGEPLDPLELASKLQSSDHLQRLDVLHRAARDPTLPKDRVREALIGALSDPHGDVRRFATLVIAGWYPCLSADVDVDALLVQLGPAARFSPVSPPDRPHDPVLARRNCRYAILWTLGLLAIRGSDEAKAQIRAEAAATSSVREPVIRALAEADARRAAGGLGEEDTVGLPELLAYATLRSEVVGPDDPLYWLVDSATAVRALSG